MKTLPCHTFEDTLAAVHEGRAELAMIPIDNSVAGRVAGKVAELFCVGSGARDPLRTPDATPNPAHLSSAPYARLKSELN